MPPNFFLTNYFYPIAEAITLSSSLGFTFDNPRTEKEIKYAREFITDQYNSGLVGVLPPHSKDDVVTLELIAKVFVTHIQRKMSTLEVSSKATREMIFLITLPECGALSALMTKEKFRELMSLIKK